MSQLIARLASPDVAITVICCGALAMCVAVLVASHLLRDRRRE